MSASVRCLIAIILILLPAHLAPIDNPHFYRALRFWDEPRFERSKLSSWQINTGFAQTNRSRGSAGKYRPPF